MVLCLAATLQVAAQGQQGHVRTPEKSNKASEGIEGVTMEILGYPNQVLSRKGGHFSFTIQGKKQGTAFKVTRVEKKGYTLAGNSVSNRTFAYSSSVPIEIVMQSNKQLAKDKKKIEDKGYAKAKKRYDACIAELERKYKEKAISERERDELTDLASRDYEQYIQLLSKMAERYALTDYKGLSDINRQIQQCIEEANLERADALINSKGDFDKREQEIMNKRKITFQFYKLISRSL